MPRFEEICDKLGDPRPHENFRLWCTTCPSPIFPTAVLQNSIKMAIEPPKGLRANLVGSYSSAPLANDGYLESNAKPEKFRKLCYSLCIFHAVLQERRLYGPLGWNIPYGFNESDMLISLQQLFAFLEENEETPFKALKYCIGECNYGGRVTDGKDRITLNSIMERFFNEEVLETGYKMSQSGTYSSPGVETREEFLEVIEGLPLVAPQKSSASTRTRTSQRTRRRRTPCSLPVYCVKAGEGEPVPAIKMLLLQRLRVILKKNYLLHMTWSRRRSRIPCCGSSP